MSQSMAVTTTPIAISANKVISEPLWVRWLLTGLAVAFLAVFLPLAAVFTEALSKG